MLDIRARLSDTRLLPTNPGDWRFHMATLGLESTIQDPAVLARAVKHLAQARVVLPTFSELAQPSAISPAVHQALSGVDPDGRSPLNLFRVHWYNDGRGGIASEPAYLRLPPELTGVQAPILVALGRTFPMIHAHKVLAAYGCLVPRIVTGQFDPTNHRAVWPSTGNYCRGGIAISRILGCRGVAVLPEGMSRERFDWLDRWVESADDIVRTPGSESNVKEIYDCCAELDRQAENIIFNQFCEYGNYLIHWRCTGPALGQVFEHERGKQPDLQLAAYVSATGSGGTLAAGDYLKDTYGAAIAAAEALECPTLLANGYGEHNIQGIGDKHVPLIHNVMNTDFVVALSDRVSDGLGVLFNHPAGHAYLRERHGFSPELLAGLPALGLSSLANIAVAIKLARYLNLGPDQAVITVATDSAAMYASERERTLTERFGDNFDQLHAAEVFGEHLRGLSTDNLQQLRHSDRNRVFNLGYYTWVEQQGVDLEAFEARRSQAFWHQLRPLVDAWDGLIREFNAKTGVRPSDAT